MTGPNGLTEASTLGCQSLIRRSLMRCDEWSAAGWTLPRRQNCRDSWSLSTLRSWEMEKEGHGMRSNDKHEIVFPYDFRCGSQDCTQYCRRPKATGAIWD